MDKDPCFLITTCHFIAWIEIHCKLFKHFLVNGHSHHAQLFTITTAPQHSSLGAGAFVSVKVIVRNAARRSRAVVVLFPVPFSKGLFRLDYSSIIKNGGTEWNNSITCSLKIRLVVSWPLSWGDFKVEIIVFIISTNILNTRNVTWICARWRQGGRAASLLVCVPHSPSTWACWAASQIIMNKTKQNPEKVIG